MNINTESTTEIRCTLLSLAPFPIGNVSTIRYSSYLKELVKNGIFTKVLILAPTSMASKNESKSGIHDGIYFQYLTKITWRDHTCFITKIIYYLLGLFLSVKYLKKDRINCLILYHQESFAYLFYWVVTRVLKITYLTDKSEYPYGYSKMAKYRKKVEQIKLKVFDGFIVMTNELVNFYSKYKSRNADVLHLPMTIRMDRYSNVYHETDKKQYISVVFGIHNRDGLYESIQAYNLYRSLADDNNYYKLVIIGDFEKLSNQEKIQEYIEKNRLTDDIIKTGLLPIDDVPQLLFNAQCLLTTPNEYVSGGFPTKLGEYMLSGVPIVATSAGEISDYLTNGENIYMTSPGDIEKLAHLLLYVQNNQEQARLVADNAAKLVRSVFNAESYSNRLIMFLRERIVKRKVLQFK